MHCAFLLRTIFASSARAHECARAQNVSDLPQTKLDSEINAPFLLYEHGDPHFLFYKFNENNILSKWDKNWQKSMATFLVNEINATDRDITGPTEQVQIMFPLKVKKYSLIMQGIWRHFFWDVDEYTMKESRTLYDVTCRIGK